MAENSEETAWGKCNELDSDVNCFTGEVLSGDNGRDLKEYVGKKTVKSLYSGCACTTGRYGPLCNSNEQPKDLCVNGRFNPKNYLTGCECRTSPEDETIIPFHGWYCEIHNVEFCAEGEVYNKTAMTEVGDDSARRKVCIPCDKTPNNQNCAECHQDRDIECE